jgi:threonine dehydrogenase-like Zn-dependent dehydrogenase
MDALTVATPARGRTARAAVIAAPRRAELRDVPLREPAAGEVLLRLHGSGVCGSNLPVWEGRDWFDYPLPEGAPGHEGWGVIEGVGPEVDGWRAGDRVASLGSRAFAEYDVVAQQALIRIPDGLRERPVPGEPLGCTMNVFRRSGVQRGDTVAIVGIGFLGALLTQLCSSAGARVIAVSHRPYSLDVARACGAAELVRMDDHQRIIEAARELTDGRFCDVVIECVGTQWPLDLAGELTRERGRLVIAGFHQDGLRQVNLFLWNWRGIDVINAHERDPAAYIDGTRAALDALTTGVLDPTPLYTHRLPLDRLGDAMELMRTRPDGFLKALVEP